MNNTSTPQSAGATKAAHPHIITDLDPKGQILSQDQIDNIRKRLSPDFKRKHIVLSIAHFVVLALSLALITFISYDTFKGEPFLENSTYMTFQLWVCVIFIADYCLGIFFADNKKKYAGRHLFFLLISIPYLNIIEMFHINFAPETLYYIRFIPLVRGAYALMMVVGYFSADRAISLISQYAVILLTIIYFSSLIFFYVEKNINSDVNTYWDALYWAAMNVDTVGSYISAVSVVGKILSIVLAVSGMMMLPLFTVFVTAKVKQYNDRRQRQSTAFLESLHYGHHEGTHTDEARQSGQA